jgi:hypothetical protein
VLITVIICFIRAKGEYKSRQAWAISNQAGKPRRGVGKFVGKSMALFRSGFRFTSWRQLT